MNSVAFLAWFVAGALVWGAVDVVQAASTSGGVGIVRLALLSLFLYAACGLVAGLVTLPLIRRRGAASAPAASLAAFGLVFSAGYANVAFLPSITHPLSIAANLALLATAALLWFGLSRLRPVEALGRSIVAALGVALVSTTVALAMAGPSGSSASREGVAATADASSPSVIVVVLDSVRVDRTSLGGRGDTLMPAFEGMLESGWGFSRAWAQSSWTKPSVGSLFTSLYPSSHGATLRTGRLAAGPETLPEAFAKAGYATGVFSSNPWISPAFGFERGVGNFVESERESFVRLIVLHRLLRFFDKPLPGSPVRSSLAWLERGFGVSEAHRSNCERDVFLVDEFERWLDRSGPGPFFAYFHLMSPHIPYSPPGVAHEDFPDAEQVELQRVTTALAPERRARLIELYDATVVHGDAMLARVLAAVDSRGLGANSVVVATADHGEEFHEHGAWGHGNNLHEETIRVPLAIRAPGLTARRIDSPVMLIDVLPTLAVLAGARDEDPDERATSDPATSSVDGSDLHVPDAARPAFSELTREGGYEAHAVVRGSQKYLETKGGLGAGVEARLYDLDADPAETNNRLVSSSADVVSEWAAVLAALREKASSRHFESDSVAIDAEAAERLRGLGYLE